MSNMKMELSRRRRSTLILILHLFIIHSTSMVPSPLTIILKPTRWKHRVLDNGEKAFLRKRECVNNSYVNYFRNYNAEHLKAAIVANPSLNDVIFEEASLGNEGTFGVLSILNSTWNQIELLSLNQNDIGTSGLAAIFRCVCNINGGPKILSLERNNIRDTGLRVLPGLMRYSWCVEELNLRHNCITARGMRRLASVLKRKKKEADVHLERLYLGGNVIGDEGLVALCVGLLKGGSTSQLKVLDLNGCGIGDIGVRALVNALSSMPNLVHLDLGRNPAISSQGVSDLCRALRSTKLESLDVRGAHIGDDGAGSLGSLLTYSDCLKRVHMGWNSIGPVGVERFVRRFKPSKRVESLHVDLSGNRLEGRRRRSNSFSRLAVGTRALRVGYESACSQYSSSGPIVKRSAGQLLVRCVKKSPNLSLSLCGCGLTEKSLLLLDRHCKGNVDLRLN